MKTLNYKEGNLNANAQMIDNEDRQPCWYANMDRGDLRTDYKWNVGRKYDRKTDEYSFDISEAGDVSDDSFWSRITGLDFAISLIDVFKNGGQKSVKKWVENGCL